MIRGANNNTHDSTEYFHIHAGERESVGVGDAPAEESAAEERASLEERYPEPEQQEAEEVHVEVPPGTGYSDAIGLYPLFPLDTTFHHIHIRQF